MPRKTSEPSPPGLHSGVTKALTNLGFSQYEARTYAGLIGRGPLTGYAVAKETQVPQPKVYETLSRLVDRGIVLRVTDSPAKFVAVPPSDVLRELESEFRERMATVELELSRIRTNDLAPQTLRLFPEATSWIAIVEATNTLVGQVNERLYVSGHSSHLEALRDVLTTADARGVRIDLLCFGEVRFALRNGTVMRHSSTDGVVYRHHQARHLAISGDSTFTLWALAPEGDNWEAMWADNDPLLTALVKGFIRHDIFAQRMYQDHADEMQARYGPGLEGLFEWQPASSGGYPAEDRGELPAPQERARPRARKPARRPA